jgi:hypothetical protein
MKNSRDEGRNPYGFVYEVTVIYERIYTRMDILYSVL